MTSLKFYYKYKNKLLPECFDSMFSTEVPIHDYNLRRNVFIPRPSRKVFTSKCIRYFLPKLLRETPPNITVKVTTHSLQGFSSYTKRYYINTYLDFCTIPNCYVCNST